MYKVSYPTLPPIHIYEYIVRRPLEEAEILLRVVYTRQNYTHVYIT